jgi:hypothetical protein
MPTALNRRILAALPLALRCLPTRFTTLLLYCRRQCSGRCWRWQAPRPRWRRRCSSAPAAAAFYDSALFLSFTTQLYYELYKRRVLAGVVGALLRQLQLLYYSALFLSFTTQLYYELYKRRVLAGVVGALLLQLQLPPYSALLLALLAVFTTQLYYSAVFLSFTTQLYYELCCRCSSAPAAAPPTCALTREHSCAARASAQVLSLLALLVQKYTY